MGCEYDRLRLFAHQRGKELHHLVARLHPDGRVYVLEANPRGWLLEHRDGLRSAILVPIEHRGQVRQRGERIHQRRAQPHAAAQRGLDDVESAGLDDAAHHVLVRDRTCYALLNTYPYNGGHLMVVPYRRWPQAAAVFHRMLTTGERLKADRARELGVVDEEVVDAVGLTRARAARRGWAWRGRARWRGTR